MENAFTEKVGWCKEFGIDLKDEDWPYGICEGLTFDRAELFGKNGDNLVNAFGISAIGMPSYRGDFKNTVEKSLDLINLITNRQAPGSVPKKQRKGARNSKFNATLSINEYTKMIINNVLNHNKTFKIDGPNTKFRMTEAMIKDEVKPHPIDVWNWSLRNSAGQLRQRSRSFIRQALLPKESATITRRGVKFKNLFYDCKWAEENYNDLLVQAGRRAIKVEAKYDPRLCDEIYLVLDNGRRIEPCSLQSTEEDPYKGKSWYSVEDYRNKLKAKKDDDQTEKWQADAETSARNQKIVNEADKKTKEANRGKSDYSRLQDNKANRIQEREGISRKESWNLLGSNLNQEGQVLPPVDVKQEGPELHNSNPGTIRFNSKIRESRMKGNGKNGTGK
ncbi:MAG: hypothetical protein BGO39_20885 [Chloroflexi bacterium 54-19]|nr:MAG: hypothetical protein BGO39_20885 [Chloroflexi bacterium 54-19]